MLINDNVSMSVGHLDHVLTAYSSMDHMTWKSPGPMSWYDPASRWIKEALWIRKTPTYMNRDAGSYQLSHTWDQVISRSRGPSSCKQTRCDQDVRFFFNPVLVFKVLRLSLKLGWTSKSKRCH